jgi:hypothetical protein
MKTLQNLIHILFQNTAALKIMGNLLYAFVIILVTAWSIVFIGYRIGGMIHVLLVIAFMAVVIRFFLDKRALNL